MSRRDACTMGAASVVPPSTGRVFLSSSLVDGRARKDELDIDESFAPTRLRRLFGNDSISDTLTYVLALVGN